MKRLIYLFAALLIGTSGAVSSKSDFERVWDRASKIVPIPIPNPAGVWAPFLVQQAKQPAKEIAKGLGIDPDGLTTLVSIVIRPGDTQVKLAQNGLIHVVSSTMEQASAYVEFTKAVASGNLENIGNAMRRVSAAAIKGKESPLGVFTVELFTQLVPVHCRGALMENPTLHEVTPTLDTAPNLPKGSGTGKAASAKKGEPKVPIYYINGMRTGLDDAKAEAQALADRFQRKVLLLHNESSGDLADGAEVIGDRFFPVGFTQYALHMASCGLLGKVNEVVAPLSGKILLGQAQDKHFGQPNKTTRQLTHILHHLRGRADIVSHSQGCLIVRNALITASRFQGADIPEKNVAWVATGVPLRDSEVLVKLGKRRFIVNANDPVPTFLGLRVHSNTDYSETHGVHSFVGNYVNQIKQEYFW